MPDLSNKTLTLFFTYRVSLKLWDEIGILDREIKPYKELAKHFKEIYLFTYGGKEDLEYQRYLPENIKIYYRKSKLPLLLYSFFFLFIYKGEIKKADILKSNQMSGAWTPLLAKLLFKKRFVARCGYEWLSFLENQKKSLIKRIIAFLAEKVIYKKADRIILTSEKDKKFVVKRFKIPSQKIKIIPNYIDTEFFKPLPLAKEKNRIIFAGRLEPEKNLFNLLKALPNILVKLVLVGRGSLKRKLKQLAEKEKINIEFIDIIANKDLPKEYNKSELFILPSLYEGCPKALLEAMSCGLPCIGSNVQGIKEIIIHKENGYLCEITPESIKRAIIEVLINKDLQDKIGKNARKTILENFSLNKILEKEKELYLSLLVQWRKFTKH